MIFNGTPRNSIIAIINSYGVEYLRRLRLGWPMLDKGFKSLRGAFVVKTYVLLIAICPSDGYITPGAFDKSRLMPAPGFFSSPFFTSLHHSYITYNTNLTDINSYLAYSPIYRYKISFQSVNTSIWEILYFLGSMVVPFNDCHRKLSTESK